MGQGFITCPAVGIVAASRRSRPLGLTRRGLFRPERALGSAQLRLEGLEGACELREQLEVRRGGPSPLPGIPEASWWSPRLTLSASKHSHGSSFLLSALPQRSPGPFPTPVFPPFLGMPAVPRHSRPRRAHRCRRSRCPQLLDGRRRTGGRLEVWVRIREPLGPQRQLEPRSERWLVLEPGAEAMVSAGNPPGTRWEPAGNPPGTRRGHQPGVTQSSSCSGRRSQTNRGGPEGWEQQVRDRGGLGMGNTGNSTGRLSLRQRRVVLGMWLRKGGGKLWDPPRAPWDPHSPPPMSQGRFGFFRGLPTFL